MSYRVINSSEQNREVIEGYDTWHFDCDGVLWRGSELIEGASEFLHLLRSRGTHRLSLSGHIGGIVDIFPRKEDTLRDK